MKVSAMGKMTLALFCVGGFSLYAVEPVVVAVPDPQAELGQRLPFFVELRAKGSFAGATNFSLPQVAETVIIQIGNAVVSSENIEGESCFVQRHEFALFSQHEGTVHVPAFRVRFGTRSGFSGPVSEVDERVPGFSVDFARPPGTDPNRFLVTTASLAINEQWDPVPEGEVKTGTVFKRTITQTAENMTGMALASAPTTVPEGIKVYPGESQVDDDTERGSLRGRRVDTLTYLVEKPGQYLLPALRYDWWNPEAKSLDSKTLPALSFTARAPVGEELNNSGAKHPLVLFLTLIAACGFGLGVWAFRRVIFRLFCLLHAQIDPPDQRAARGFLRACRRNDPRAATEAWALWNRLQGEFVPTGELKLHLLELQRYLYGLNSVPENWNGSALASAFRHHSHSPSQQPPASTLPPLNP